MVIQKIKFLLLFLTVLAVTSLQAQVIRTFNNGSFESPTIGTACYATIPIAFVPGWQTSHPIAGANGSCIPPGFNVAGQLIEIWSTGFLGVATASGAGRQFAELDANVPSTLYQTVCLAAGETLNYSFLHRGRVSATQRDLMNFSIYSNLSSVEQQLVSVGTTNNGSINTPIASIGDKATSFL